MPILSTLTILLTFDNFIETLTIWKFCRSLTTSSIFCQFPQRGTVNFVNVINLSIFAILSIFVNFVDSLSSSSTSETFNFWRFKIDKKLSNSKFFSDRQREKLFFCREDNQITTSESQVFLKKKKKLSRWLIWNIKAFVPEKLWENFRHNEEKPH